MKGEGWTRDEDAILRDIANRGGSFLDVSVRLNRSRCMIAGRANRLGVKFRGKLGPRNPNTSPRVFGETHPFAKLTEDDVRAIRSLHEGGKRQRELAHRYGVTQACISRIVRKTAWRHLGE